MSGRRCRRSEVAPTGAAGADCAVRGVPRSIGWLLTLIALTTFGLLAGEVLLNVFLFPVLLLNVAFVAAAGLMVARRWWSAPAP